MVHGSERVHEDWEAIRRELAGRDPAELSAGELDALADALFWTDRLQDSIDVRGAAYRRFAHGGELHAAAMAAWRLFYEHWLLGETVVGRGWLDRARSLIDDASSPAAGWLAIADADVAMAEGRLEEARAHGLRAVQAGGSLNDPDLLGMALQAAGRAEILDGRLASGLARLDRAMIMVIGNELDAHFTGWVYCNVIATCHGIADLRRANEWCDAALRWCDTLRNGELYPGLCRVYAAELDVLRGEWDRAAESAASACSSLMMHDERYAGAAHYMVGETARLRGDSEAAMVSYGRAHELGFLPQPGLGLLRFQLGDTDGALAALRSALRPGPSAPMARVQLISALVDVAVAGDDAQAIDQASGEMARLASGSDNSLLQSYARSVDARIRARMGDDTGALAGMRSALDGFLELRMPYEAARERERIALVCRTSGDHLTAEMEAAAALAGFRALGASVDAARIARLVDRRPIDRPGGLTGREVEVVRLVAEGLTNREVADRLFVSRHTVARHLGNVYTKLGVGSRAAATAWAYDHGLIEHGQD